MSLVVNKVVVHQKWYPLSLRCSFSTSPATKLSWAMAGHPQLYGQVPPPWQLWPPGESHSQTTLTPFQCHTHNDLMLVVCENFDICTRLPVWLQEQHPNLRMGRNFKIDIHVEVCRLATVWPKISLISDLRASKFQKIVWCYMLSMHILVTWLLQIWWLRWLHIWKCSKDNLMVNEALVILISEIPANKVPLLLWLP